MVLDHSVLVQHPNGAGKCAFQASFCDGHAPVVPHISVAEIEYGGVASPDDLIEITIAAESGFTAVVQGLNLQNTLVVRAFCATANVVMMGGYVNRISP